MKITENYHLRLVNIYVILLLTLTVYFRKRVIINGINFRLSTTFYTSSVNLKSSTFPFMLNINRRNSGFSQPKRDEGWLKKRNGKAKTIFQSLSAIYPTHSAKNGCNQ